MKESIAIIADEAREKLRECVCALLLFQEATEDDTLADALFPVLDNLKSVDLALTEIIRRKTKQN